jgi:hypothetical protein
MNTYQFFRSPSPWLICESKPRWAPAIRTALARDDRFSDRLRQLREFRGLVDLANALPAAEESFICIEIGRSGLAAVLNWLPQKLAEYPHCHAVAGLAADEHLTDQLHSLLIEAGFLCVTESPRAVHLLIDFGRRHDILAAARQRQAIQRLSQTEQVWAELPWHPDGPRVG